MERGEISASQEHQNFSWQEISDVKEAPVMSEEQEREYEAWQEKVVALWHQLPNRERIKISSELMSTGIIHSEDRSAVGALRLDLLEDSAVVEAVADQIRKAQGVNNENRIPRSPRASLEANDNFDGED